MKIKEASYVWLPLVALCGLTAATAWADRDEASKTRKSASASRAAAPVNPETSAAFGPAAVNTMIRAEWAKEKIIPAPPVDDARYLRRVTLDITGTIPSVETVKAFLADKSPDKRAKVVDALLNSPAYVENATNYWDAVLMGRNLRPGQTVDRGAFRQWLHGQFERNVPWNQFVYSLITATGQNSTGGSYAKGAGLMMKSEMENTTATSPAEAAKVNGAVNWYLKYAQTPADLSGNAAKIFLGRQVQCAQCHDHKTEPIKQTDFIKFTACFTQARPIPVDTERMLKGMRRVELRDVNRPFVARKGMDNNNYNAAQPTAFDGTDFSSTPNRRQALAAWMTAPENPYFAEAIVNRVWAHMMGRGFVEPIDDFRSSNPAVMPELLKKLADDFVAHDYDLKHLIRTIAATEVYQLSAAPGKNIEPTNKLWARYRLKPLNPDELMDTLMTATNMSSVLERVTGGNLDAVKFGIKRQFTFLFDVDEENEQKEFEGTIPQALMLLNGNLVNSAASLIPGTALAEVLALPGDDAQKIESLYLRTVSRKPTATEMARWTDFVNAPRETVITDGPVPPAMRGRAGMKIMQGAGKKRNNGADPLAGMRNRMGNASEGPKQQAYEDMFWTLLNSSEFMFNH